MDNLIVFDTHPQFSAILKYLHFEPDSDQAEIAEELGVSQMTISRTEKEIRRKFAEELHK